MPRLIATLLVTCLLTAKSVRYFGQQLLEDFRLSSGISAWTTRVAGRRNLSQTPART